MRITRLTLPAATLCAAAIVLLGLAASAAADVYDPPPPSPSGPFQFVFGLKAPKNSAWNYTRTKDVVCQYAFDGQTSVRFLDTTGDAVGDLWPMSWGPWMPVTALESGYFNYTAKFENGPGDYVIYGEFRSEYPDNDPPVDEREEGALVVHYDPNPPKVTKLVMTKSKFKAGHEVDARITFTDESPACWMNIIVVDVKGRAVGLLAEVNGGEDPDAYYTNGTYNVTVIPRMGRDAFAPGTYRLRAKLWDWTGNAMQTAVYSPYFKVVK